ncbi:hypothetical protein CHLNCDRAFT_137539 [Chlorella variabilis]|uniref:Photosystem II Psb27 protein n=1 Tax=Chlorella variabilis TaxID=554065 RepID=E1Z3X7_CHLVA|nr:hypothetical protein CHLNCDRAFT_137539 [Chlorella variabilis]EFN59252.1 hypothetical protein CHLNCDRAFT_137539 [Chlorella variabilis]|eukprot:XP_005851354.1 hypothetical protein CHLNCDRAFT_137539 [Chlorella variabilis]
MALTASSRTCLPFQTVASGRSGRRPTNIVVTQCSAAAEPQVARRSLLGVALLAATSAAPAQAILPVSRWDGESSAVGSCELGEAGDACPQAILAGNPAVLGSYDAKAGGKRGAQWAGGVPVADMGAASPYARDTLALTDRVLAFAALNGDPANPERIQLVKELKTEFPGWVSKYARGGSARTVSARKVYVVVDAISAHFAQNGLAPVPKTKMAKLEGDVQVALAALAEGR